MILKIRDSSFEAYKSRLERIKRDPNSTTKELKDIVDRRKEITKKLKELTQDTSKMDRKEFWYKFTDIFDAISQRVDGIDNYSHFDNIDKIPDTDNIKMRLMSRFNDKTIKRIKTNINIPGRVFFDGIHNSYEVVNNVSFEVITDLPIDFNRVYTRKEVLDLYNTKKIFFKNMRLDTTNEKINSSSEFLDFYGCKNELEMPHCLCGGTSVFPAWYEQPLTIEIIRRSGDMKSQIATLTEQYITQNKILAKEIKEMLPEIKEREESEMTELHTKEVKEAEDNYKFDIQKAQKEYEEVIKKAKKILTDKQNEVKKEEKERQKRVDTINSFIK